MGMLVREGSTKNGNWKIVKSENQAWLELIRV
jgi:hypothetical protein